MKAKAKMNSSALMGILVFIAVMLIFISIPFVSYAQTGTLGTASPEVYCTYEKDGVQFDGDNLPAGTYDVSFVLSGMAEVSVLQVTAAYDTTQVTVADAPSALLSDGEASQFDSMGYKLSDGNIVFGFISTNEDSSAVNQDDNIIATVSMTFAADCDPDADNLIIVSENPNHTFAQADYGDGYKDEYAIVDDGVSSVEGYDGRLYSMKCDVTPGLGHSVTADLVIMTDKNGSTKGTPVYGEYKVDVYDAAGNILTDKCTASSLTVNANNETVNRFILDNLTDGVYTLKISSQYAITRDDITVKVNGSDITYGQIPIIACNFNGDKGIAPNDASFVYANIISEDNEAFNLNGDKGVAPNDTSIVYACIGTPTYKEIVIQ